MKGIAIFLLSFLFSLTSLAPAQNEVQAQEDNQLQEIQDRGTLRVGTSGDFPPMEFYAEIDGERRLVGVDIFIAEEIAKDMGVELEVQDMGFDSLIPGVETGNIDMILAGMSPTEERRESLDFSDVYFEEGQHIMIRQEDEGIYNSKDDFAGDTVGVQSGSLQEMLVQQIPDADVLTLTNINDLLLALETGRINGILISEASGELQAAQSDNLVTIDGNFDDEAVSLGNAVAMSQNEPELVDQVNSTVSRLQEEGRIEEFLDTSIQYFTDYGETGEEEGEETEESQSFIGEYAPYFWDGTKTTLFISFVSVLIGTLLGTLLSFMRLSSNKLLKFLGTIYVEFIRGTPLMIQVMFIYFGSGIIYPLPAMVAGIAAVSLNSGAYVCEIIRSGLSSVDTGQAEAARSLGMSKTQSMRHIIFPQALKNIWPSLGNEFITIIKESSIVSVIGVSELIFQSRVVRSISFQGILPLFITMLIYFVLTYSLTKLLNYFEGRMNYD